MNKKNPFENQIVEFHILQSFPATCLNRDDVGAPKTALIGGTTRARVSSQCWKRQVRLEMKALGAICGERTKAVRQLISDACLKLEATQDQADACGAKISDFFVGKEKTPTTKGKSQKENSDENSSSDDNNTLIFLSKKEVDQIAKKFQQVGFDVNAIDKEIKNLLQTASITDALDIALFGRMVAKAPSMNIEGASCFSHAISTHKVENEIEFFTALDTLSTEAGAAHLGSSEFNSATYYRYISLNLGQLYETLLGIDFATAVEYFIKALFLAIPSGKQNSFSGASVWDFAKIYLRKGQRMQVPFTTAVRAENGGFLTPSIKELENYLTEKKVIAGSLFQEIASYTIGEKGQSFSIDHLIQALNQYIKERVE